MSQKIACVIPSYNHAAYIAEAIRSVVGQTLPPERLVIVDDGSQDDSVAVVRAIKDPRIHLIVQDNQGAHAALTRGLELCRDCDFVSVLNSDDRYHPERFARCLDHLDRNPGTELVCTRIRLIDEFGIPVGQLDGRQRRLNRIWSYLSKSSDFVVSLGYGNFTKTTSNFLFRRGAITEFRPYRYVHDYFAALTRGVSRRARADPSGFTGLPCARHQHHQGRWQRCSGTRSRQDASGAVEGAPTSARIRRTIEKTSPDLLQGGAEQLHRYASGTAAAGHHAVTGSGRKSNQNLTNFPEVSEPSTPPP